MIPALDIATALLRRDDFEGLHLASYLCPAGYWTIGYGNRFLADGSPVTASTSPITENEAIALLRQTLVTLQTRLREMVTVPLTPWQEGALLSWQFNIGSNAMQNSTLLRLLNQRLYTAAGAQLLRWDKATVNGHQIVLRGLQNRRRVEQTVFTGRPVKGVALTA